tara:strand:+ start:374 stop:481 length:108 start_codon:yes stop_codon:yes gene_type:complete
MINTPGKSFLMGASEKKYQPSTKDIGIEKYSNGAI